MRAWLLPACLAAACGVPGTPDGEGEVLDTAPAGGQIGAARVKGDTTPRTGTRFSHLTSAVWRYGRPFEEHHLDPVPNNNPLPEPQPHRDRPGRVTIDASGTKAYVTLTGTEEDPSSAVVVVDLARGEVLRRLEVGRRPYAAHPHPGGRFLVVTNELSNVASVIDTTTDQVTGTIPLDYYAQGMAFSPDGTRAWVAIRYLDQVLALDLREEGGTLRGTVREVGGFDADAFLGAPPDDALLEALERRGYDEARLIDARARAVGGIDAILRGRCGTCHQHGAGGFLSGPDPVANLLSAVEHAVGGRPEESVLVRAVTPASLGGYGDQRTTPEFHSGGALFEAGDPELDRLVAWIRDGEGGPGIFTGNEGSHPKDLVLGPDGRHLFVGNTGTQDIGVIDVVDERLVGSIHLGNVAIHLARVPSPAGADTLVALSMGAGFGAPPARDPHGAETWDREHPAAQFALLRDPETTDPYPIDQQPVLGPFDAVDGTWNSKMRDIQNDLVAIDLHRLRLPSDPRARPDHLLRAHHYTSTPTWVRYTSDTAEATTGDVKGDLPPELQRVPGAFPAWSAVSGDRLFVAMAGTFELVEWKVDPAPVDPADRLVPLAVHATDLRPTGVAASDRWVVTANQLGETVSIFDRTTGARRDVVVGDLTRPPLDTDAEKGELVVHASVFTSDGDTSCMHCHYNDTGDGRGWGAAESIGQDREGHITHGGTLGIPQMRNVYAIQPFYFEGTHRLSEGQGADITEPASSIDFDRAVWAGDFTAHDSPVPPEARWDRHEELKERQEVRKLGSDGYTLDERRDQFFRHQALRHLGAAYGMRDLFRFVGVWMGNTTHLLPNPFDPEHPSVRRGERLFHDPAVMCGVCHAPPEFTNKTLALTNNDRRALPQLTTVTRRDASYTLASVRAVELANQAHDVDLHPEDRGRVEGDEGSFTTMQLRGIFDRPPVFLHHGRARSLREVLATPGHPGLRAFRLPVLLGPEDARPGRQEVGLNETTTRSPAGPLDAVDQVIDTHGGTSHLTARQLEDLMNFLLSVQ